MRLLITTPLETSVFDTDTRQLTPLRMGDGEYFGSSWNERILVFGHTAVDGMDLVTWQDYRNAVVGFLRIFRRGGDEVVLSAKELVQPHQILCVDDRIVVANTGRNCLSVFDESGALERHVYLTDKQWDRNQEGRTGNHFNSLFRLEDRLYVLAHNFDRPSAVWRLTWPGLERVDVTETAGSWAHNLWPCEWGVVMCDSKRGRLIDALSGKILWESGEERVMTRGLAATDQHLFIGRTEYGGRTLRQVSDGGLWVVDRQTMRTVDRVIFPGSGTVNDVRILDGPDACHPEATALQPDEWNRFKRIKPLYAVSYGMRRRLPFHKIKARAADKFRIKWGGLKKRLGLKHRGEYDG